MDKKAFHLNKLAYSLHTKRIDRKTHLYTYVNDKKKEHNTSAFQFSQTTCNQFP